MSPIKIDNPKSRGVTVGKAASILIDEIPVHLYPDKVGGLVVVPLLGLNVLGLSGEFQLEEDSVLAIKDTLFTGTGET